MAQITGVIIGAYRDDGFILDNNGNPVKLIDILNMLLDGEGAVIEADNGLYLNEPNKVHLGGNIIENTTLDNPNHYLLIGRNNGPSDQAYIAQDSVGDEFSVIHKDGTTSSFLSAKIDQVVLDIQNNAGRSFRIGVSDGTAYVGSGDVGQPFDNGFVAYDDHIQVVGVRTYANDAAAQADVTLPAGGIYHLTADPVLRFKQ